MKIKKVLNTFLLRGEWRCGATSKIIDTLNSCCPQVRGPLKFKYVLQS
jgi:hypothetical protein